MAISSPHYHRQLNQLRDQSEEFKQYCLHIGRQCKEQILLVFDHDRDALDQALLEAWESGKTSEQDFLHLLAQKSAK